MTWAKRLKRVFGIEIDRCGRCAGQLKIIASIEQPDIIGFSMTSLPTTNCARPRNFMIETRTYLTIPHGRETRLRDEMPGASRDVWLFQMSGERHSSSPANAVSLRV